jgi:integrase
LAEELRAQLRHCPIQPSALVFGNRAGNPRRYRVFRRDSWDPAVQAMAARREATGRDLIAVTPHDLRATCASLLIDAGASVKDVQAHLGHKDITTTLNLSARVRPGRSGPCDANGPVDRRRERDIRFLLNQPGWVSGLSGTKNHGVVILPCSAA